MAKTTWGRKETIIWPQQPAHLYLWRDLRRHRSDGSISLWLAFDSSVRRCSGSTCRSMCVHPFFGSFSRTHRSQYRMLFLTGRGLKPRPAMNDDVVRGKTPEPGGRIIPLALSPAALQHGNDLLFRGPVRSYVDARLQRLPEGCCL